MKCVGVLALLISIQWIGRFIDLQPREVVVQESQQEFVSNGGAADEILNTENKHYVKDGNAPTEPQNVHFHPTNDTERGNAPTEPQNVHFHPTNDTERVDSSQTTTQTYVADDADLSSESINQSEPYFFIDLENLLDQSSNVLGNISNSTASSIASITSSLNAISTASFEMLPKVADHVNLIYTGLSKVAGPDIVIRIILIRSLPSIFHTITSAVNELESAIGVEASEALKKFIVNVKSSLKTILLVLNGLAEENVNILETIQEIARSVQYVASSVTSISLTIYEAIDRVNKIVVEAVISLQLIFAAVLNVTQWVLSLGVSIFYSLVGNESEILVILSQLTILISNTLENVSRICSVISMIRSDSLENIFVKLVPLIQDLKQLVTLSYTPISGNAASIVFNIDQILTDNSKQPVVELKHDTAGTIPEILNNLSGKLISLSPDLSSALFSLNNSLKISSHFGSSALKVISNILILVLTRLTSVNHTASEILSLISDLLDGTFGHLFDVLAKFSVLGDVSESLKEAVLSIHNALRLLIDSINFSIVSTYLNIDESIKNVAKTCQILISSFSAIFEVVSQANRDISNKLSEVITYLPYIVSTLVVVVQFVLGASIPKVLVTFGSVPSNLQELALAISTILQRITSITANITLAQSGTDVNYGEIISNSLSSVSELKLLASTSLSAISEVLANVQVSLDVGNDVVQ
ncbi:uncharacterized protein LOC119081738 [Bradysia coprophila]|uniref:uncharacterized protein LOC119081738 n=1 Tax=Bradysia coprophila TaxID=38358 RepID=UPI00187D76C1|nr:uncharacterized protein LOC119081738 [Bradysia coprophila]